MNASSSPFVDWLAFFGILVAVGCLLLVVRRLSSWIRPHLALRGALAGFAIGLISIDTFDWRSWLAAPFVGAALFWFLGWCLTENLRQTNQARSERFALIDAARAKDPSQASAPTGDFPSLPTAVKVFADRVERLTDQEWATVEALARGPVNAWKRHRAYKEASTVPQDVHDDVVWIIVEAVQGPVDGIRTEAADRNYAHRLHLAKSAALGLAAWDSLTPDQFTNLYEPFQEVIPLSELATNDAAHGVDPAGRRQRQHSI